MRINENKRHKKGESGRAWVYKCVIMVLSNNKDKRFKRASILFIKYLMKKTR